MGLGFRVWVLGLGFRVQGLGFRVSILGIFSGGLGSLPSFPCGKIVAPLGPCRRVFFGGFQSFLGLWGWGEQWPS